MVNKKGYIRTLESVIAIVILIFATYALTPRELPDVSDTPYPVVSAQDHFSKMISTDNNLKYQIINVLDFPGVAQTELESIINERLPAGYDYQVAICDTVDACVDVDNPEVKRSSIYIDSVLVLGEDVGPEQDCIKQCGDGIDNDGDGKIDFAPVAPIIKDDECDSAIDNSESVDGIQDESLCIKIVRLWIYRKEG